MCRLILPILIGLFCFGPTLTAVGQTRRIDSSEVLKQLMAMYVDEKQAKIYLVYKGQLLRLPLPAASK